METDEDIEVATERSKMENEKKGKGNELQNIKTLVRE